jgi:tRNA threonylcarbamoyladenosine biosynthesis protein TsaE
MEITFSLNEIKTVASKLISHFSEKTILFYGDMGVGKTTLIKELAKELGVVETMSSPTFSIVNEYQAKNSLLYHFDCFRLTSEQEAFDIGIEEYLSSGHFTFIEWPQNIGSFLSKIKCNRIELKLNANGTRTVMVMPKG